MKNKVLVAMGIGVAAAMVPAVASTADVIDLENLTQEQIDTIEKIEEAEATNEQEEVNFGNDGDLLDDAEVHLVPDAAPIQEGSLSVGSDDKENPVHYADIILNNNVKEEFSELNTPTPSPSPSASPVVSASPMPSIEPRPSDAPAADRVSGTALVLEGGSEDELVPSTSPVDMAAKQKAEQKAEDLKNAGFEDVNITTEEIPANLPDFVDGIEYSQNNDPIPTASREDIINDLLIMKKMGGFEELIPYDEEALKNLTDEDLQKFKNIKVLKETKTFSDEGLTREVLIGAVKDLREAGVKSGTITFIIDDEEVEKSLQDLTDEDIDNLTDEQLEGLKIGFAKTTITDEVEISVQRQTGLTQVQLAEQLTLLRAAGYDALEHKALCQFFGVDTNQSIEEDFYKWSFEDLERLGLAAGITVETKPIEFTEDTASTRQGLTRDEMLEALSELQEDGYEALAGVNLDNVANMSDEELNELLSEVIAIEELHIDSELMKFSKGYITKVLTKSAYQAENDQEKENYYYKKISVTYDTRVGEMTSDFYLKYPKDIDIDGYELTNSEWITDSLVLDNGDNYKPNSTGLKMLVRDGITYVITDVTKAKSELSQAEYDELSEKEQGYYNSDGHYVWICKVYYQNKFKSDDVISVNAWNNLSDKDKEKYRYVEETVVDKKVSANTGITLNDIDKYSVITLTKDGVTKGSASGEQYLGSSADTNQYFNSYYNMLLDLTASSFDGRLKDKKGNLIKDDKQSPVKNLTNDKNGQNGTKLYYVSYGPDYTENFDPTSYNVPVYYVTGKDGKAYIYESEDDDNIMNAVYVLADSIKEVFVKRVSGVVVAPKAKITVVGSSNYNTSVTAVSIGTMIGKSVAINDRAELKTGKIDIVGQDTVRYKSTKDVYYATAMTYKADYKGTEYSYSPEDQPASFTFDPITQPAKVHYTYEYNASVDNYGMIATPKFYKYTVTGHMATTISYYGEAVVDTPPVAPPPTPDDEIITTTLVFGGPVDVADDFVAAPLAAPVGAVLGANREIEGTVLGAQVSGSVLGERRGPQGAVLGKRRSPKTADAAMGGMIAGMMLSMMTAFGGATVLKKKRKDEE